MRLPLLLTLGAVFALLGCGPPTNPFNPQDTRTMDAVQPESGPPDAVVSDRQCSTNEDCDNHVFCDGQERCVTGHCVAPTRPACDDGFSCSTDSCDETARMCNHVYDNSVCGDHMACNGIERCIADGTSPNIDLVTGCERPRPDRLVDCDDGNVCTVDSCDDTVGCVHAPRDLDGDGHVDRMCSVDGTPTGMLGDDCNDGDSTVYPGAPELCDDNRDNNCNGLVDLADSMCRPMNNTCATATMLPGPGVYWASVMGLTRDYSLSCGTTGLDAVWTFNNPTLQDVTVSISATDGGAAVAVTTDCAMPNPAEVRCARPFGTAAPTMRLRSLPPGMYRIIGQTTATTTPFRLTLRFDPATAPLTEDACPAMEPGPNPDLNDGMVHRAQLSMLQDDHSLSCFPGAHREVVYRLTLTAPSDIVVTATPVTPTAFSSVYLSVRGSPCAQVTSERRCLSAQTTSTASPLPAIYTSRGLPAGTYWVLVEQTGDADVNVQAMITTPPAPRATEDACPVMGTSPAIELSDPMNATRMATLTTLEDDHVLSCSTMGRRDAVYRLTLAAPSDVILRATSATGTTYMSVRPGDTNCGVSTSERRCTSSPAAATAAVFTGRALPAGIYWVLVENSSDAPVTLTTMITTPPAPRAPEDVCPPTAMSPTADLMSGVGRMTDLSVLEDDYMLSCGTANRRDAVYRVNVTATSDLRVNASAATGTAYLSLRGAGCGSGPELRCLSGNVLSPTQPATLTARDLAPGDYWVFAEQSTDGAITVTPTLTPSSARLPLEYCPGQTIATDGTPSVLNWGVPGTPGALDLVPDLGTSCGSRGTNTSYRDAVMTFTLATSSDVNVSVTSASGTVNWDLRSACTATAGTIIPCQATAGTASRRVRGMLAGTYYLVLESISGTGPTTVTVTATPAAPAVVYTVAPAPASVTWIDACALPGAMTVLPNVDDSTYAVPSLPFATRVYDNVIPMASPSVNVSSNGYLTWVPSASGYPLSGTIPTTFAPFLVSALYWNDLETRSMGICIGTRGTAPNRQWVVEWTDNYYCCGDDGTVHLQFELILNEAAAGANNTLDYLYNRMDGVSRDGGAGLENEDGTLSVTIPGPFNVRSLRLTPSR